jgi:phosphoserine phosphatase RsbU/P
MSSAMNEPVSAPARLLVVDDNPNNLDLLTRRLQRLGHDATPVEGGRQALAALRGAEFDLVLLDINMPEMDGYQVLREIKEDPALRHLPVVMVSALDEIESVVRCLELGAEDYLTKPFNPVLLRARVESSLAKKRLLDGEREQLRAMERELQIGREIQAGFLPDVLPQPEGWYIGARFTPARQVGGDFYDVFALASGRIALVVADVCDKGVGAALYMALFRSLIRAIATGGGSDDVSETLRHTVRTTNDYIASVHGNANMFATVFIAVLDPVHGRVDYINAGHDAPLVCRAGTLERLERTGPALGLLPDRTFDIKSIVLNPGDMLFAYTDGVTDAGAPSTPFGEERLARELCDCLEPGRLLDSLERQLGEIGGARWDDVTMMLVHRLA